MAKCKKQRAMFSLVSGLGRDNFIHKPSLQGNF